MCSEYGKNKNSCSQLTIVIPTHERHNYLKRSMEYWKDYTGKILVIDSSVNASDLKFSGLRKYIHVPGMSGLGKISLAVSKIETPYSVICADDDFHALDTLDKAVSFLDDHQDFASIQGYYIAFWQDEELEYGVRYYNIHNYSLENEDPAIRMTDVMRNYMHQFYAVQRTPNIVLAIDACSGINNGRAIELMVTLVSTMAGKHRVLPFFYSAREDLPNSGGLTIPGMIDWVNAPDNQEEVTLWKMNLAQTFVKVTGQSLESGLLAADEALKAVREGSTRVQLDAGWKARIRPYIPEWFIEIRRRLLAGEHLWHPLATWHPSSKWATDSRAKYRNIPGYPWSDSVAEATWAKMSSIIRQYGPLYK